MEFEWDPNKANINFEKHKITFEDATDIFEDPHHYIIDVTKPEFSEPRYLAIGVLPDTRMLAVVYTDRERRRIISARKVRRNEQREYDLRKASS